MRALTTAATGMKAQEMNIDVIANNLANVSTAGFKRSETTFEDLLYVDVHTPGVVAADGTESARGFQIGSGSALVSTSKLHTQGTLEATGRDLDIAIDGKGFFELQVGSDVAYSRAGSFALNSSGQIVSPDGHELQGLSAVPDDAKEIMIGRDGTVSVLGADNTISSIGNIQLHRFPNPAGLMARGANLYTVSQASGSATAGSPGDDGYGTLKGGYVERSNVDVVGELINLIMAQRAYEVNSRAVKAGDEMMSLTARLGRS
jgi:flagellar basal-body rod protein FlgG